MSDISRLLSRLEAERFTGELVLHISAGAIDSARLSHHLPFSELSKPLSAVDCANPKAPHLHGVEYRKNRTSPTPR